MRTKLRWLLALGRHRRAGADRVGVRRRRRATTPTTPATAGGGVRGPDRGARGRPGGRRADRARGRATSTTSTRAPPTTSSPTWSRSATQSPLEAYAPDDVEQPTPLLADRGARGLRGRQDDHLHDPRRRHVLAAGRPRGDRGRRQVRDRALAAARRRRTATCRPTWPASTGIDEAVKEAQDDPTGGAPDISGITAPDDTTLEIKLTDTSSLGVIGALTLPVSAPVPEEYAKEFDAENPSTYGENQVATGPYMIENDAEPASSPATRRTRRSTWSATRTGRRPTADFRPAYLDEITIQEGFADTVSASKKILAGSAQVNGDFTAPPTRDQAGGDRGRGGPADADPERRQPLHRAEHADAAVRRHQRPQGRDRERRTAPTCATPAAVS